jgi:hypothetical protein
MYSGPIVGDNFTKWEKKLMEGSYIHHAAEIEGSYSLILKEFRKYVPNLSFYSPDMP